jgi:hypothetical protein
MLQVLCFPLYPFLFKTIRQCIHICIYILFFHKNIYIYFNYLSAIHGHSSRNLKVFHILGIIFSPITFVINRDDFYFSFYLFASLKCAPNIVILNAARVRYICKIYQGAQLVIGFYI